MYARTLVPTLGTEIQVQVQSSGFGVPGDEVLGHVLDLQVQVKQVLAPQRAGPAGPQVAQVHQSGEIARSCGGVRSKRPRLSRITQSNSTANTLCSF